MKFAAPLVNTASWHKVLAVRSEDSIVLNVDLKAELDVISKMSPHNSNHSLVLSLNVSRVFFNSAMGVGRQGTITSKPFEANIRNSFLESLESDLQGYQYFKLNFLGLFLLPFEYNFVFISTTGISIKYLIAYSAIMKSYFPLQSAISLHSLPCRFFCPSVAGYLFQPTFINM